jgi:hypothetical protein
LWCKIEPLAAEPTTDRLEAESDSSDRDGDRS